MENKTMPSNIVRYRYLSIINNKPVGPWLDMPEVQPPTVTGLMDFLRSKNEIPESLQIMRHPFIENLTGTYLDYGPCKLFRIPVKINQQEIELLENWNKQNDDMKMANKESSMPKDTNRNCWNCRHAMTWTENGEHMLDCKADQGGPQWEFRDEYCSNKGDAAERCFSFDKLTDDDISDNSEEHYDFEE
jgi:hypothetical protein